MRPQRRIHSHAELELQVCHIHGEQVIGLRACQFGADRLGLLGCAVKGGALQGSGFEDNGRCAVTARGKTGGLVGGAEQGTERRPVEGFILGAAFQAAYGFDFGGGFRG